MILGMYRVLICMFYLSLSTTIFEVDRAILNVRTLFPPKNREKIHISINVDYLLTPSSVSMFIEGLSLEARYAAQAERRAANTAMAQASASAAAAAESPPFFALSPPTKMDSIVSPPPPTPASADGPTPAIAGSLAPLVYAEDFIEGERWWGGGALAGR